jgi:hypothetical protein
MLYNGDTFEIDGISFRVSFPSDDIYRIPWEESEGHGPVSEWTRRDKRPGELILSSYRGEKRYYDFQEACKIALRDSWGAKGDDGLTGKAKAAFAVRADYEYLRHWCNDQWYYVGVIVTMLDDDADALPYEDSVWGIESDCHEYLEETARDLAAGLIAELERNLAA